MGTATVLTAVSVLLPAHTALADFDSGCAAFDRGDYQNGAHRMGSPCRGGTRSGAVPTGWLHTFGQGVPADYALALRLYRVAAERGDADAQNNLGGMYAEGLVAAPDRVEAYMWFELAARAGHELAGKTQPISPKR